MNELTMEKFSRHIDNEMYLSGEELNLIMKIFSVISILFMPPAVVGGIFGMNVKVPWMGSDSPENDSMWPFTGLMIFMVVWIVIMYIYMRHLGMTSK